MGEKNDFQASIEIEIRHDLPEGFDAQLQGPRPSDLLAPIIQGFQKAARASFRKDFHVAILIQIPYQRQITEGHRRT